MNVSFLITNAEWRRCKCQRAVHDGLRALGHHVKVDRPEMGPRRAGENFHCAFIWNGIHSNRGDAVRAFGAAGKPAFIMERGFFDRTAWTQIDAAGFNHTASWAHSLSGPAPRAGRDRFEAVWGAPPTPMAPRRDGYVLVLLQVSADSQLANSEIHHPGPLVDAVQDALPHDVPLRVRAHPIGRWNCGVMRNGRPRHARMLSGGTAFQAVGDGTPQAKSLCHRGSLAEAVAGARFCITINSNAGNEALAWGCPVLCLGPALYESAGAAMRTTLAGMADAIRDMLDGWCPAPRLVENYLHHLACRQYGIDELAAGGPLREIIQ